MDRDLLRYIIQSETFQFVDDYLAYMLDARGYYWEQPTEREGLVRHFNSDSGQILLKLADHFRPMFRKKFRKVAEAMMRSRNDFQIYMWTFGEKLFSDGFRWDKIAALLVFCSELGAFCMDSGRADLVDVANTTIASYVIVKHFKDILERRCWVGFIEFCQDVTVDDYL